MRAHLQFATLPSEENLATLLIVRIHHPFVLVPDKISFGGFEGLGRLVHAIEHGFQVCASAGSGSWRRRRGRGGGRRFLGGVLCRGCPRKQARKREDSNRFHRSGRAGPCMSKPGAGLKVAPLPRPCTRWYARDCLSLPPSG